MKSTKPAPYLVADHLALDFLNSICAPSGEMIDWLDTGPEMLFWLINSKAVSYAETAHLFAPQFEEMLAKTAHDLRELREFLRTAIEQETTQARSDMLAAMIPNLNLTLANDQLHYEIDTNAVPPRLIQTRTYNTTKMLKMPIYHAIADLILNQKLDRVRNCDGPTCTVQFLDVSKNGKRRWCSMQVCGNRAKAATHRHKNST